VAAEQSGAQRGRPCHSTIVSMDALAFPRRPGGVAERLNAAVSKTVVRLIGVPGVRISPPPLIEPDSAGLQVLRLRRSHVFAPSDTPLETAQDRLARAKTVAQLLRSQRSVPKVACRFRGIGDVRTHASFIDAGGVCVEPSETAPPRRDRPRRA
jgi:hypothetical protein